jgi:hypothetical protein
MPMTPGASPFLAILRVARTRIGPVIPDGPKGQRSQPVDDGPRRVESVARLMKHITLHALVLIAATLSACSVPTAGSTAQVQPTAALPSSPPAAPATFLPSPTPPLTADFQDVTLIPGRIAGDWTVIGLITNQSAQTVGDLVLDVGLYDEGDVALAHLPISPALPRLGPEDQSPFTARFTGAGSADHARAEVVAYRPSEASPTSIEVGQLQAWPMDEGRLAVFGRAVNAGGQTVEVDGLAIMASSSSGQPLALSETTAGLSLLDPGEATPFVTVLETDDASVVLEGFVSGRSAARQDLKLELVSPLKIEVDQQGSALVIGSVRNDSQDWLTADVIVSLQKGDELMGLGEAALPWPLAPGETQAFLLDEFPGMRQRLDEKGLDPGGLSPTGEFDPAGSRTTASKPVAIEASITAQEVVGGSVFLKGTLTNGGTQRLYRPGAMAVLRSTEGEVISAGFVAAGADLEAGASLPFTLTIPLPEGVDLAMAEYDVRAAGFLPE